MPGADPAQFMSEFPEGERREPKIGGSGGTPPGKFLRPRPLDWLKML